MYLSDVAKSLTSKLVFTRSWYSNQSAKEMKIDIIPALQDNYMYLLTDPHTNQAAVIDPVEPEKVRILPIKWLIDDLYTNR